MSEEEQQLQCSLVIDVPFPTYRLANSAYRALSVDQELSSLVQREFTLIRPNYVGQSINGSDPLRASLLMNAATAAHPVPHPQLNLSDEKATVLRTIYRSTTNRMLRVAVNGFFESLNVVLQVMEELDVDVIRAKGLEGLEGAQGVEQGMIGTTTTGG
ncbi:hypothetical protein AAFC00_000380 [Neodothiora populina]|uniref:Pcc1-domain-containing protein n=1 Tax=Neodothiora populina TaxID=2781224 RepID=A0ABR3PCN6_9PEZI